MFGNQKLVDLFCKLGNESTNAIKNGIVKALKGYESDDDITMVVIKRIE